MRRFIGPNWPKYRAVWLTMKGSPALVQSGSYAAATFALLDIGWLIDLGIAALLGIYGKSIVVRAGIVAIARIKDAASGADDDSYSRIVRAGGTNIVAPIAGTLIAGLLIAGAFIAGWQYLVASGNSPGDAEALISALRALQDAATQYR